MSVRKKKKSTDYEALNSPIMRIPKMNIETARVLIDLGIRELYELEGRSPEVLFEEYKKKQPNAFKSHLYTIRLAVYYAECEDPDPVKLHPQAWT